jgi:ribosomal protein S18 acetylase RimI-like enzyme
MEIAPATPADAADIVAVTHAAFRPVARQYGVATLPPLQDTEESVRALMADGALVLKAVVDGRIVGSVRGAMRDGTCEVGRLVVLPEAEGRGIGTALARALEDRFPQASRFELFTGHLSDRSIAIYRRLGYTPFRTERLSDTLSLVYLEKRVSRQVEEPSE